MQKFAVIGLGRFGSQLAKNLTSGGHEVIGIDRDESLVNEMRDYVTLAVTADTTDEAVLKSHGVGDVDVAVVCVGNDFEAVTLATVSLKSLGVKRIVSRAWNPTIKKVLERIGADEVVDPETESAERWTTRLCNPQFMAHYDLSPTYSLVEVKVPGAWVGKTLVEVRPRQEYGVNVVAIKKDGGEAYPLRFPDPGEALVGDDVLVMLGRDEDFEKLPD